MMERTIDPERKMIPPNILSCKVNMVCFSYFASPHLLEPKLWNWLKAAIPSFHTECWHRCEVKESLKWCPYCSCEYTSEFIKMMLFMKWLGLCIYAHTHTYCITWTWQKEGMLSSCCRGWENANLKLQVPGDLIRNLN